MSSPVPKYNFDEVLQMNNVPVVGVDIAKGSSEAAVLAPNNSVYCKTKINHCFQDFNKFVLLLEKIEKEFKAKPVIVMEATGHYFKLLFYFLKRTKYEVILVNPLQTNSIKDISLRKVKNDKVDAKKIALLYRLEELRPSNILNEDIDNLRSLCRQYHDFIDQRSAFKNRLTGVLDQIMLNYSEVFKDVFSKTSLAVLERYPTPSHILKANRSKLISLIADTSKMGLVWSTKKYELLYEKAKEAKPISISSVANVTMLRNYLNAIKAMESSINNILESIEQLVERDRIKKAPVFSTTIDLLLSIPGIGPITATTIAGEVADFSVFKNPSKLVAFFGLDASVRESGTFKGTRNKISKRGSSLLRKVLYQAAMVSISKKPNGGFNNPVLHEFYERKCISKPKNVALIAVMRKLVFVMFAVLRDKKPFVLRTPEQHELLINSKIQQQAGKVA